MDEETIEIPVTPQITESSGSLRRNLLTPEVTEPKDGTLKLSSTGRTRSSVSGEKVIPHYLRASTGSCHDSCKYGGHHTFEGKEKLPIRKGKRIPSTYDGQHPIVSVSLLQMSKKKPLAKLTSPDPGIQSCDTPEINQHDFEVEEKHPIPKRSNAILSVSHLRVKEKFSVKLPSPDSTAKSHDALEAIQHAVEVKEKLPILKITKAASLEGQHMIVSRLQRRKKKPSMKLPSPDSTIKSHGMLEPTQQTFEAKGKDKILRSTKSTSFQGQDTTVSRLHTREKKPSVKLPAPDPGSRSRVALDLNQQEAEIIKQKALSSATKVANVAKSAVAFKPRRPKEKFPSLLNPPKDQSVRKESGVKTERPATTSKVVQKKDPVLQKSTSLPKPSLNRIASLNTKRKQVSKGASPLKYDSKTEQDEFKIPVDEDVDEIKTKLDEIKLSVDEEVIEKILRVTESEPESEHLELDLNEDLACVSPPSTASSSLPSTSSSPPSLALHGEEVVESEYSETETESEYDESETDSECDESEDQNQLKKSSREDKTSRRAATVYPEDGDPGHKLRFRRGRVVDLQTLNNTPRRLRFRKGKVLGDDRNGKGDVGRKSLRKMEGNDLPDTSGVDESEKVVLRHQDTDGKKDAKGLFNNVIEETASKLAETRKSKVKALVGAFETVISLQETKPSAASHSSYVS